MAQHPHAGFALGDGNSAWLAAVMGERVGSNRAQTIPRQRSRSPALVLSVLAHAVTVLALVHLIPTGAYTSPAAEQPEVAMLFEAPPAPPQPAIADAPQPPAPVEPEVHADEPPPVVQSAPPLAEIQTEPSEDVYRSAQMALPEPRQQQSKNTSHRVLQRQPSVITPAHVTETTQSMAAAVAKSAVAEPVIPPRPVSGMETNHPPGYPEFARRRGEQGRVMLRVSVSADGTPLEVDVAATSGFPVLDSAALSAVRQWSFVPATQAGAPVSAVAEVPVRFRLEN
jgi:protein TonB